MLPVYLSSNLLYYSSISLPLPINVFWNFWNHSVTPVAFVNLLLVRFRERSSCLRIDRKKALHGFGIFWLINILLNIYFSFDNYNTLPYGAVTNWNWKRPIEKLKGLNGIAESQHIVYNFQLAFFSFVIVGITTIVSFLIFWVIADSPFKERIQSYRLRNLLLNLR
ncbi:hypothetical protein [Mycoplasma suis]|uniref:hypothetical protein n=1 Tax=Mycoplasma suis TaxID=57372 RepID=UPI00031527ED|nr:hypothetical protein [Mycoplasma suis]